MVFSIAANADTLYEAESATRTGGAIVATNHTGYTGTGFVAGFNDVNKGTAQLAFTVDAATAGSYSLALRYANATGSTRTLSLYLNGTKLRQTSLNATANWDTWAIKTEMVSLVSGNNTVAYKFDTTDSGVVNLDNLTVSIATPSNGLYRIRNSRQTNQYLYESGGKVLYGTPAASDLSSQWALIDQGGHRAVWNASTGNSITVTGVSSAADPVLTSATDTSNNALWNVTSGTSSGFYVMQNVAQPSWYVNLEGLKGFAQAYAITPSWGSPQWAFEYVGPVPAKPGAKADLIVTSISWSPVKPAAGQAVTFSAIIKNTGTAATPAGVTNRVSFAVNGSVVTWADNYNSALAPGASAVVTANGPTWAMSGSAPTITAKVNDPIAITESNTSNNTLSALLTTQTYGASMPYTAYEAEAATHTGTLISGDRTWGQLASEASGRAAVKLSSAGQFVDFKLTAPAKGLVVRYSIPDSADGSAYTAGLSLYINGVKKQDLTLTNKYSWLYGVWTTEGGTVRWSNNPSATPKNPHRFFDEIAAVLDASYLAGTTIRLMRESSNLNFASTSSVTVDFIEAEAIPAALSQPSNYASITSYGAVANDGVDDTAALNKAIAAVKASGGSLVGVWIPVGSFDFNTGTKGPGYDGSGTRIYLDSGVSLRGAGPWYSKLQGAFAGIYAKGGNITVADLKISAYDVIRDDVNGIPGIEGKLSNSTVKNVWFEHTKVGIWVTPSFSQSGTVTNATITGNRIRNVWADGLNLHYGTSNSLVSNNNFRNTGDDGIALWSQQFADTGNTIELNTVQLPTLANGIAVYGGQDNIIRSNLIADTIDVGAGISFGTNFSPAKLAGSLTISGNMLLRTGSYHHDSLYGIGGIWAYFLGSSGVVQNLTVTLSNNIIQDSTYAGILFEEPLSGATVKFDGTQIVNTGTYGVEIKQSATGSATFTNTTVTGVPLAHVKNNSTNFVISGSIP